MDNTAANYVKAFLITVRMVCMLGIREIKNYLKHVFFRTSRKPAILTVRIKIF